MFKKIYFIIGVSGVGKTTVMQPLRSIIGPGFEIKDFDERGVPNNAGRQWRLYETKYWIDVGKGNSQKNITTIICGFAKPSEISDPLVSLILLDASEEVFKQRLWNRYQTPESIEAIERVSGKTVQKFIGDNVYYSGVMREEAKKYELKVIDTNNLSPEGVARQVKNSIGDGL